MGLIPITLIKYSILLVKVAYFFVVSFVKGTTLVIDIGGGSTELIIGKQFKTKFTKSIEMGSRSFSQRYFNDEEVTEKGMRLVQSGARKALLPILQQCRLIGWKSVLGTSGSFKSIRQIMLELYGDSNITEKRIRRFIKARCVENIDLESIEVSRFTVIASTLAIISSFMDLFTIKEIDVSSAALREGVLYGLNNTLEDVAPRDRTVNNLLDLHNIDQVFSKRVLLQLQLFNEQLKSQGHALSESRFMFLQTAALLHEIGLNINSKKRQKHGAYILEHTDMPGFSEQEQQIIASIIGHHRGNIKTLRDFDLLPKSKYLQLVQLLRLAIILTLGRREFPLQKASISYIDGYLHMTLPVILFKNNELFLSSEKEILLQQKAGLSLKVLTESTEL